MSDQQPESEVIHWGGEDMRRTSLHGNGAAALGRTTREGRMVTCRLCQSLLGKCDGSSACEATVHIHGCYADNDSVPCDDPAEHEPVITPPVPTTDGESDD